MISFAMISFAMISFAMIQSNLSQYGLVAITGNRAPLHPARKLAASATALLLIAGAFFACSTTPSPAQGLSGACEEAAGLAVLPSPIVPWRGAPLRVLVTAEKPFEGELSLIAPDGSVAAKSGVRHGGPPYFWFAEVASPTGGTWHMQLTRDRAPPGCGTITREIVVRDDAPPRPHAASGSVWPVRNSWNRATENLYSAWIEKLFDAPLDAAPSWKALHEVLRDRSRNLLFNSFGSARRRNRHGASSRLRRPGLFPARLFRL